MCNKVLNILQSILCHLTETGDNCSWFCIFIYLIYELEKKETEQWSSGWDNFLNGNLAM